MASRQIDRLDVDEFLHAKATMFAAIARVLDPAEGHIRVSSPERVDADHASVEVIVSQLQRAFFVLGKYAAAQTIAALVRDAHGIFVVSGADHSGHRSKDFIVIGGHTGGDVDQHSGRIIGTDAIRRFSAAKCFGPLGNAIVDLSRDGIELAFARQWAKLAAIVGGIGDVPYDVEIRASGAA